MSGRAGHTVVITGATRGLGRELSLAAARAGGTVLGLYGTDESAAERLRGDLEPSGTGSRVVRHDVATESPGLWRCPEIERATRLTLVNNAWAPFAPGPFHLLPWEEVERGWDVGLRGAWCCARALLRPMARGGHGTIVNVLSGVVHGIPPKGFSAYAMGKHALRGLTLALASEYAARGIRVFSVSPGFMETSLTARWEPSLVEAIRAGSPASDTAEVAGRIWGLIESASAPGLGEDHPV